MDYIRSAYITNMRFFKDDPLEIPVLWYRCAPDAKDFPFYHHFASRNWDSFPDYDRGQVGEVPGAKRPWNAGINPGVYDGQSFFGLPAWFVEGAPVGAQGTGRTTCYFEAFPCSCSRVTSEDQTNYTRDAAACSCSSVSSEEAIGYVLDASACSCSSDSSDVIIDYVYLAFACSCSSPSSLAIGPYYLTGEACSCASVSTSQTWLTGLACSCSSISSSRNILTGEACTCSAVTSSRTWLAAGGCSCSAVSSTHTP